MKNGMLVVTLFFLAACGRMATDAELSESEAVAKAKLLLDAAEATAEGRGIRKNQSQSLKVFFGASGKTKDCRYWSLRLGGDVTLEKVLRSEKKQGDNAWNGGGTAYVEAYTYGGIDGVQVSLPNGGTLSVTGIVRECGSGKSVAELDMKFKPETQEQRRYVGANHVLLISR